MRSKKIDLAALAVVGAKFWASNDAVLGGNLYRIAALEDAAVLLGTYQGRREASKALEKIAYEPEPQW
jgi:hypothetical protein